MWYHFKGTIEAKDYEVLLNRTVRVLQGGVAIILLIFAVINGVMQKNILVSLAIAVVCIVLAVFYLEWKFVRSALKTFQPTEIDQYVTQEALKLQLQPKKVLVMNACVYFFQGKNQVAIFKKSMLEDQSQWDSFVEMTKQMTQQKK
ncbi:hypothetical protein GHI93_03755 [Lactococcus hircilactis]|uniref:Uncharacterized protein n=1 Tax=Lactococcus hircilactis TaxID=1494462 RepID=A0A7X2D130_9LACT|nr:hypothetical protein [Lactococcus hircilactis]MQW39067.1 hypothetical protein [Lactococcus hircilactis]